MLLVAAMTLFSCVSRFTESSLVIGSVWHACLCTEGAYKSLLGSYTACRHVHSINCSIHPFAHGDILQSFVSMIEQQSAGGDKS